MEVFNINSYIIIYDLVSPGKEYEKLINSIKEFTNVKVCNSNWIINSSLSAVEIRNRLKQYIDNNDRLFIGKLTGEAAWHKVICPNESLKNMLH